MFICIKSIKKGYDNEPRPHPNQHMPNTYHPQAPIRNQQFPYNNNSNTNTRYIQSGENYMNSNNLMMNQRNDQGFDFQNGYMNNQRNPQNQCKA